MAGSPSASSRRTEGVCQGLRDLGSRGWPRSDAGPEVREVVLVEDHAVVLEPEPPRELGGLWILAGCPATLSKLGKLVVELVHLFHVSRAELEMLGDLQAMRSAASSHAGRTGTRRSRSNTRRGVPRSLQVKRGSVETARKDGHGSRIAREKFALGISE